MSAVALIVSICGGFFVDETDAIVAFWIVVIGLPLFAFALWQIWRRVFSEREPSAR